MADAFICPICSTRTTGVLIQDSDAGDHVAWHTEQGLSQMQARRFAETLNGHGVAAIAVAVPHDSWGGTEEGWTVELP